MADPVDELRSVLGVATDQAVAIELGLERSTIAQWRRRGALPARYRALLDATQQGARHAIRRQIYGDGNGRFIVSAALGFIPLSALDLPEQIMPANVGWARETALLNMVSVVLDACEEILGKRRCESEDDFIKLMFGMETAAWGQRIKAAGQLPSVGER